MAARDPTGSTAVRSVVLVSGAAGRLGLAVCEDLARDHDVLALYRSSVPAIASQLQWPIGDSERSVGAVHCIQGDLTKRKDLRRVVEVGLARFGQIDAVVNCVADIRFHGRLLELTDHVDNVVGQLRVNAIAPVLLVSEIFQSHWKHCPEDNSAQNRSVVNVSSISGHLVGEPQGQGYYAASKAALDILSMYQALELAPYSVRVNTVCPSRMSDRAGCRRVVQAIRGLLTGTDTGTHISGIP